MKRNQKIILAGLLAVHLVLLALVLSRNLDFLFNDAAHRIGPGSDFWALYNAGKHWLLGDSIYMQGPGYGYRYHPIFAQTILVLIANLRHDPAYWLWVVINELFFAATLIFIRRLVVDSRHFLTIASIAVFFAPYYLEIYMGNATFMVAAMLLAAFYFYGRHQYRRFYFIYLASILVKPIGLLMLPVLLVKRHYRMVALTVVILVGLGIPYFWLHPEDWQKFWSVNLGGLETAGFLIHGGNQGFSALLMRIFAYWGDVPVSQLASVSQLPALGEIVMRALPYLFVLSALALTWKRRNERNLGAILFVWAATYLLAYRDIWEHTYSLLFFGMLQLYLARILKPKTLLIFSAGLALPTAFAFYDITFARDSFNDPDWHWSFGVSFWHHLTKPIWLIALYGIVITKILGVRERMSEGEKVAGRKEPRVE